MNAFLDRHAPWFLALLRIVAALVYMEHGTQKLFHFPAFGARPGAGAAARSAAAAARTAADTAVSALSSAADTAVSAVASMASHIDAAAGAPPPGGGPQGALAGAFLFAGVLETFGGLALVLGLLTRPLAFIVAGECAVVYWWMHVPRGGFFPVANGGESAVLFCFTFLYLVFAGPGAFALDNLIFGRKAR